MKEGRKERVIESRTKEERVSRTKKLLEGRGAGGKAEKESMKGVEEGVEEGGCCGVL